MAVMTMRALRRRDRMIDFGDMFAAFPHRFGTLVLLFFIPLIPLLLGLACCFIPFLVLATWWMHAFRLVMERDTGMFDALGASKRIITESGFWTNFWLTVVEILIIAAASSVPCLGWIAVPFITLVGSSAYLQQTGDVEYAAAR
jgi:hypothetical protein